MKIKNLPLAASLFALLLVPSAKASLIVTYAESPDSVNSTLSNTEVYTFDSLTANAKHTDVSWTGVGTFDALYVKAADQYGGAVDASYPSGSPYSVQSNSIGGSGHITKTTLTLTTPSAYFGFWWSAGDKANVMDFYSGGNLVAEFTTANLMLKLKNEAAYLGNPRNRSLDSAEPFAFINFYGETGTTWDKITFSNIGSSGFESDNYTSRVGAWGTGPGEAGKPVPGVVLETVNGLDVSVPEPGTALAGLLVAAGFVARRFSKKR